MPLKITAVSSRGSGAGTVLVPHRNRDGKYIVSQTKFAKDQVYVDTLDQVADHIELGYKVRMSPETGGPSNLMSPGSIKVERV